MRNFVVFTPQHSNTASNGLRGKSHVTLAKALRSSANHSLWMWCCPTNVLTNGRAYILIYRKGLMHLWRIASVAYDNSLSPKAERSISPLNAIRSGCCLASRRLTNYFARWAYVHAYLWVMQHCEGIRLLPKPRNALQQASSRWLPFFLQPLVCSGFIAPHPEQETLRSRSSTANKRAKHLSFTHMYDSSMGACFTEQGISPISKRFPSERLSLYNLLSFPILFSFFHSTAFTPLLSTDPSP